MRRVPQPPVNAAARPLEVHDFWPAFVVVVIALVLGFSGARRLTALETVDGGTATEGQLIRAFSTGGLKFPEPGAAPPPMAEDPAQAAQALERWERQNARQAAAPAWKVRVDTEAKTSCPT